MRDIFLWSCGNLELIQYHPVVGEGEDVSSLERKNNDLRDRTAPRVECKAL